MARARGGAISTRGASDSLFALDITVDDVATREAFQAVRRDINSSLRDAMVRAGEAEVLPAVRGAVAGAIGPSWAGSMYVKRDRLGVFFQSRMRGALNRALGWLDFGGRRPRDSITRLGPHAIVHTIHAHRGELDDAIKRELLAEFAAKGFEVS